jgi:hypothetical protein
MPLGIPVVKRQQIAIVVSGSPATEINFPKCLTELSPHAHFISVSMELRRVGQPVARRPVQRLAGDVPMAPTSPSVAASSPSTSRNGGHAAIGVQVCTNMVQLGSSTPVPDLA